MDVATLLYGYRPSERGDERRKALALRSALHVLHAQGAEASIGELIARAGDVVTGRFGGSAQDAYVTLTMAVIRWYQPDLDVFRASVLNAVVLEMNFQTRLSIDGVMGPGETIVFQGPAALFQPVMVHGNATVGVHVTDAARAELPVWANRHAALELNDDHLLALPAGQVGDHLAGIGRSRIGAVMLAYPSDDWTDLDIPAHFADLASGVSRHTIYCIAGPAEMSVAVARDLQDRYPEARVDLRLYLHAREGQEEYRGIAMVSGLAELPAITVRPGLTRPCSFMEVTAPHGIINPQVEIVDFFQGPADRLEWRSAADGEQQSIGRWETARMRKPFLVSSSAPLPTEVRQRISDNTELFHSVVSLRHGIVIPSQDETVATAVNATGRAEVVLEYGDERYNIERSPLYRDAVEGPEGRRHGTIRAQRLIRVAGAVMPMMFTPNLHRWHSHFIIQCVPRIKVARDLDRQVKMLIPVGMRPKQLQMMDLLGFGPDRRIEVPFDTLVQADDLLVPRAWQLAFSPYTASIYEEIAARLGNTHAKTPRRILISRESRKTWRNMLNYETVREMLVVDYHFEVVTPESLSLEEEVALYAQAEIVVGAEGAGMYGAVFSKPGTVFLTIGDEDYVMPILGTLADVRDLDIGYVFGESMRADSDLVRRLPFGHADFVVDVQRVEHAVRTAIERVDARR